MRNNLNSTYFNITQAPSTANAVPLPLGGRLMPLVVIFTATLFPQFVLSLVSYHNYGLAVFLGGIMAVYLCLFTAFGIKCAKYKNNIKK